MKFSNGYFTGVLAAAASILLSQGAWALDITINDGIDNGGVYGTDSRYLIKEDNEVEPNCYTGQIWDVEAFVVQDNKLYVIGGFNFKDGQYGNGQTFMSGDIFIDTDGDAVWGQDIYSPTLPGYYDLNNSDYLYNYVIDLDFVNMAYAVHNLDDQAATLVSVYYRQNDESNPYLYKTGAFREGIATGSLGYSVGLTDAEVAAQFGVNLTGAKHNVVEIDMSWFTEPSLLTHFTMACGNDNLMGEISGGFDVPDSGSTLMMMGIVLAALAGYGRRFRK